MSEKLDDLNDDLPAQDELTALKARADQLGITYHPSIGVEKLRAKVNDHIEGNTPVEGSSDEESEEQEQKEVETKPAAKPVKETLSQKRGRLRREALALVRVRVQCMNPAKKEWEGEIITAGNSVIGSHTKYVPFNAEEGYHIPRIIYNQLVARQCQVFVTVTDKNGNKSRKGKLIREFAVEVLPPLTEKELHDLAQRQAMAKSID